jgi:hypothetical protein
MSHKPPPALECSSEFVKTFGKSQIAKKCCFQVVRDRSFKRSSPGRTIRRVNARPRMHEQGRSPRQPNPSSLSLLRTSQNVLLRPARTKRRAPPHSQKDSPTRNQMRAHWGFSATGVSCGDQWKHGKRVLIGRCCRQSVSAEQGLVNHAAADPISAAFGLRYPRVLSRGGTRLGDGPVRPGIGRNRWSGHWGRWGFGGQIRSSGWCVAQSRWRRA